MDTAEEVKLRDEETRRRERWLLAWEEELRVERERLVQGEEELRRERWHYFDVS